jgi:GTP-binding protein
MTKVAAGFKTLRSLFKDVAVPSPLQAHEIAYVRRIFSSFESQRMTSVSRSEKWDLPSWDVPEVAFAGRSNVGKSTLINTITTSQIMKTSKMPGRTQQLHFISVGGKQGTQPNIALVDMPGTVVFLRSMTVRRIWFRTSPKSNGR